MFVVRHALKADEDSLLQVARLFLPIHSYLFVFGIDKLLTDSTACILVALSDERVVGYLLAYDRLDHPRYANMHATKIVEVMVAEEFRNKGVGRLLVDQVEVWAYRRHCRLIFVGGLAGFYLALGYRRHGQFFEKDLVENAA